VSKDPKAENYAEHYRATSRLLGWCSDCGATLVLREFTDGSAMQCPTEGCEEASQ